MANISMEVLCLLIVLILTVMFASRIKRDKTNAMYVMYSRLLMFSTVNIFLEMIAATVTINKDLLPVNWMLAALEAHFISLLCVLYIAFLYVKKLINHDLPSLRKIKNWTNVVVGIMMAIAIILPLICIRSDENGFSFHPAINLIFILLILFEVFLLLSFITFWRDVNFKRKKIIIFAYICQGTCLGIQVFNQHEYNTSLAVVIALLSFYMTLDNEDVKLIDQLSVEKERADKANESKSTFIANVSHEIRTPINAILGMDEMILRETGDETTRQYAYDIKSAATTLHEIINEILDMSKVESGKMEIIPVNYNMRSLLNDTINMIQLKADAKNLEFHIEADESIPAGYFGDEVRIKQILTNILSNSVKYTEKGGIVLKLTGEKIADKSEMLRFSIEDTGIGLKEEDLIKITQAYARFDVDKNRNVEGTGLGMNITMQLLDMMDSKLEIESVYGKGTTMSFAIKQKIWDESLMGDFHKEVYTTSGDYDYKEAFVAPNTKVLVVDDNAINRKVFIGLLKKTKLDIDEAESGAVCINKVRRNKYDIIFMDHMMPDMDGIETFHNIQNMEDNMSKNAVVIMLTANAVSGAKEMYMEEGFDDFIAKPIVPEALETMIKKYLKNVL